MGEPEKVNTTGDYPCAFDDLLSESGHVVISVWTLKEATYEFEHYSEHDDAPKPGVSKGVDGVYDIILDTPQLTKDDIRKALALLAKEMDVHYKLEE